MSLPGFIGYIAQLVEHRTFNLMAIGSSPIMPKNRT